VECEPLDWGRVAAHLGEQRALREADATLLVGADLVHDVVQCAPFARAVRELLDAWPRCDALLWAQQRHCALASAELRTRLEREVGLRFERVGGFPNGELLLGRRATSDAPASAPPLPEARADPAGSSEWKRKRAELDGPDDKGAGSAPQSDAIES
jgi:hypothetical protein